MEKPYKRSRLLAGDLVSAIVGAGVGNIAVIPTWLDGANITQTTARIAIDHSKAHSGFVRAVLESALGQRSVGFYAKGAAQPGLNLEHVKLFPVTQPPISEQTQIAKFLDYETAKIDALIEKQQQLIELLKEKRQAVISHAVTKGLNPDAPMRDSGVDWLGKVPAHWTVGRYKFCTTRVVVGIAEAATHAYTDDGVPIIRSTNIKEEGLSTDGLLYIKAWFAEQNGSKFLYAATIARPDPDHAAEPPRRAAATMQRR